MKFIYKIALAAIFFLNILPISAAQDPEEDVTKARIQYSKARWIQPHIFMQTGYEFKESDDEWSQNFTLNTARLIFNGQAGEDIFFFVQTDDLGIKEKSKDEGGNNTYIKDAYMELSPFNWFQLYAGMFKIPFTRVNIQTEASTLFQSKNEYFIPLNDYSSDGRDLGAMIRGFTVMDMIEYRIGVFEGLRNSSSNDNITNDSSIPRLSGRLSVNFMEKEEGLYNSANYIGRREVLILGIGGDFQYKVYDKKNYYGITGDVTVNKKMYWGDTFGLQAAYLQVYNNPVEGYDDTTSELNYSHILAYYVQGSYYSELFKTQAYARYNFRENSNYLKYEELKTGVTFFLNGHNMNIKLEYNIPLADNKKIDEEEYVSLMMQLYL